MYMYYGLSVLSGPGEEVVDLAWYEEGQAGMTLGIEGLANWSGGKAQACSREKAPGTIIMVTCKQNNSLN